ncbi:MAG: hypothetical protein RL757_89 [Bacteroidota bacterium]
MDSLLAPTPATGQPAVCRVAISPVRLEPSDASEIVTQILFGELVEILQIHPVKKLWAKVRCEWDGYLGWLDVRQLTPVSDVFYAEARENYAVVYDLTHETTSETHFQLLTMGARLPMFDGVSFRLGDARFSFAGQAVQRGRIPATADWAVKLARRYSFAPYLWGGRSPFGIDCSGFTQSVFKFLDIPLLRDASQQATQGEEVGFVEATQAGDLVFFDNAKGKITHVGIMLDSEKIIHASGHVRVDRLDHQGIFNEERNEYSHQLRVIKRILPPFVAAEPSLSLKDSVEMPEMPSPIQNQISLFEK